MRLPGFVAERLATWFVQSPVARDLLLARDADVRAGTERTAEVLRAASLAVTQTLDLDSVLNVLLDELRRLVPYDSACVMLLEADTRLRIRAVRGFPDPEATLAVTFSTHTNSVLREVCEAGRSMLIHDTWRLPGWQRARGGEHVRAWLGVPLVVRGRTLGMFSVDKATPGFFTEEHAHLTELLAPQAATAIENATLFSEVSLAEQALRDSEDRYRDIVEHSGALLCTHDLHGRILSTNQALTTILGYPQPLNNVRELIWPDRRDRFEEYLADVRTRGDASGILAVQTWAGERRLWEYHSTLRTEGAPDPIVRSTLHDITDRWRAQERAMQLAAIVDASDDAILGLTVEGKITACNSGAAHLYGYASEELIGQPLAILVPSANAAELSAIVEELHRGQRIGRREGRHLTKAGRQIDVSLTASPMIDRKARVTGMSMIVRDITDLKQLEAQHRQAQKMETVGRLAGGIAHDFNNLLTVILGNGELLAADLEDVAMRRLLTPMLQAAGSAASLTRQLLAFSRQQVLRPEALDLGAVIADLTELLRRLVGEDIDVRIQSTDAAGTVYADRGQLEQVILNLAANSRDAMPRGGRLSIDTAPLQLDETDATSFPPIPVGAYVRLTVADTGMGMDAATQASIFEPFFTTKDLGTGLGLATVYGIVAQSGGYIRVSSTVGRGTVFTLLFPSQPRATTGPTIQPGKVAALEAVGGGERILVVEDQDSVRAFLATVLARSGYRVETAGNADVALRLMAAKPETVDLLLTDIVMPEMSGLELASRAAICSPGSRVLCMSGYPNGAFGPQAAVPDGVAFLQKPFKPHQLLKAVRTVLDAKQASAGPVKSA